MSTKLLVILGPTASGKTRLACLAAHRFKGEIISADSRQVYRGMDIGTGKDLDEYQVDGQSVPFHLIDIKDPGYRYNIAEFHHDFLEVYQEIQKRGKLPILCGGSGLYVETVLKGHSFLGIPADHNWQNEFLKESDEKIEEEFHQIPDELKAKLPATTRRRKVRAIEIHNFLKLNQDWQASDMKMDDFVIIGTEVDRDTRRERITRRLRYRLDHGMIEEVQKLLDQGVSHDDLEYYGLEYKWVSQYLRGTLNKKELFEGLNIAIHQFAKRQMTWFRKMERDGYDIHWINMNLSEEDQIQMIAGLI